MAKPDDVQWGSGKTRALIGRKFPPRPPSQIDPRVIAGPRGAFAALLPVSIKESSDVNQNQNGGAKT